MHPKHGWTTGPHTHSHTRVYIGTQTSRRSDWLMRALHSVHHDVSELQVAGEGSALPWQHEARGGNKLWRFDVRRLSMMEVNACVAQDRGCLR